MSKSSLICSSVGYGFDFIWPISVGISKSDVRIDLFFLVSMLYVLVSSLLVLCVFPHAALLLPPSFPI